MFFPRMGQHFYLNHHIRYLMLSHLITQLLYLDFLTYTFYKVKTLGSKHYHFVDHGNLIIIFDILFYVTYLQFVRKFHL